MVKKKDESLLPLNESTIKDTYPLPRNQDTLDTFFYH